MSLLHRLSWYFKLQWKRYFASMLMLAAVSVLNLIAPWLVGDIVDQIASQQLTHSSLLETVALLLVAGISIYILRYLWRLSLYSASYQLGSILRQRLYQHWLKQPAAFFHEYGSGDLMARATNDVTAVEMSAGEAILALFDGVLVGAMVLAVMFIGIDWRLAAITLIPWPFMAFGFWKINNRLHDAFIEAQAKFSDLNEQTLEHIGAIRLLRAYGLEKQSKAQFTNVAESAQRANLKVAATEAFYEPVIFLTMGLSVLLALSVGGWYIYLEELTVGELTKFTLYLGQLIWPMFAYGWLLNLLERGRVAYERIERVLDTEPSIAFTGTEKVSEPVNLKWDIQEFQYPGQHQLALKGFAGELPPGKTLGIVGETGSGKSTFVQLLARLYESGDVSVDLNGTPLAQIDQASLRELMAFVPQESFLFSTDIADNIAFAKTDVADMEVHKAAELAAIHEDILSFPNGYDTPVGERGITLSGGQKQRIAIARTILMDSPVVVLDDALSAVDVATEQIILKHLREIRKNRSTVIVSHRLTGVQHADEIVVLKKGEPVERGTHSELIAMGGWYADMYRYQQLEQAVEEGR